MDFIKNLACAVLLQATKDYFKSTESQQKQIIKDLRSTWMEQFSNGLSLVVANELIKNPEEIQERIKRNNALN